MKTMIKATVNNETVYINLDHVMSVRDVNGHAQVHMSNGSVLNCAESVETILGFAQ